MRLYTQTSSGITVGTTTITGGTSGAIPFNGAGVYQEDATVLFWDNTNNRLGVGTNAPGANLEIVSVDDGPYLFSFRNNTYAASTVNAFKMYQSNAGVVNIYNGGFNFLQFSTSGNATFTSNSTNEAVKTIGSDALNTSNSFYARGSATTAGLLVTNAGNVKIGDGAIAPTARLNVGGSGATSATYSMKVQNSASADLFNVRDDGMIFTSTGINTTAGDSATIDKVSGRFRKDTSGTTFTLTNAFITANSIVVLTAANAAIDATATGWTISCGAGSATITFNAAPTANFDMNFIVLN